MNRLALSIPATFALLVAACGGSDELLPPGDDAPDASVNPDGPDLTAGKVAVVATDFATTGILSTIEAPSLDVTQGAVAGVAGTDPVIRRIGDELFIVNRFGGDNITILDAVTLTLVDQFATGAGTNPQDVAVVGNKLYVAALGSDSVLVIDRDDPDPVGEISLATLDGDGMPDCVSAYAVGDRVFVACGLLEAFAPDRVGMVVVIDTTDDSVETSFDLPEMNPFGWFERAPEGSMFAGDLLIGTYLFTDLSDGCLVRVTTDSTPSASCGPSNTALGGYVGRLAIGEGALWAVISTSFTAGHLLRIDLATGISSNALTPSTQQIVDLAACGRQVFVSDRTTGGEGLRVYRIEGVGVDELTTDALDVGLPPVYGNGLGCMTVPL